jgi:hypothetical protein
MNLSRFYVLSQVEYCRNFIFKRHFPIHKISEPSCEIGLWRLTANRISEIFGVRLNKRLPRKLATVLDQIEHGHHVLRAYWKNAFLKQYEKFARYLRNELCSNNLRDFGLKKGLDHLDAVRTRFQTITSRSTSFQAQCLNVHVDLPLLQRPVPAHARALRLDSAAPVSTRYWRSVGHLVRSHCVGSNCWWRDGRDVRPSTLRHLVNDSRSGHRYRTVTRRNCKVASDSG